MRFKVRVRGVYATALSKILHERGLLLVDVSDAIAKRLGIDHLRGEVADVTIKSDDEDPSNVLVIGFPEPVKVVVDILTSELPYVVLNMPVVGLYTTFKTFIVGKKDGDCIIDTPYGKASIIDVNECIEGSEVYATSIKVPLKRSERVLFSNKLRVVGYYAILGRGNKITFSNFIKNKNRISELVNISSSYIRKGYSIHWRSNVDDAELSNIINELSNLMNKLHELEKNIHQSKPLDIIYEGEKVALIVFSSLSKDYLDSVRGSVTPTAPYHHRLRGLEDAFKDVVELMDVASRSVNGSVISRFLSEWILNKFLESDILIKHVKPDGSVITLGKGRISKIDDGDEVCLNMERVVNISGVYDGIEAAKEVGDKIITEICEGKWWIRHEYFSSKGKLKGIYVNINTPPEFLPHNIIKYVDLGIDLVKKDNGLCKLVDVEEFRNLVLRGFIRFDTLNSVISLLDKLITQYCINKS
ncbi:MAG: DUF402 domain-containing protein [Sulfolobales archaeon]